MFDVREKRKEWKETIKTEMAEHSYSPDLNPIEKMWSKMKAVLRCWKIRRNPASHGGKIPRQLAFFER